MRLSYGSQASKSKAGIQLSSSSQFMDDNEVNHKQMHHTCKVVSTLFRFINSCSCPTTFFLLHTNHHCPGSYQKLAISSSKVKIEITVKKSPLTVYAHTNLPKKKKQVICSQNILPNQHFCKIYKKYLSICSQNLSDQILYQQECQSSQKDS